MTAQQLRISEAMKLHWRKRKARAVRSGLFRYVRWGDVDAYHKRGWMVANDLGQRHGIWATLMWHCECGEVQP